MVYQLMYMVAYIEETSTLYGNNYKLLHSLSLL